MQTLSARHLRLLEGLGATGALTDEAAILTLEARSGFARSPFALASRTFCRNEAERWLFRFALGRALAAPEDAFGVRDAHGILEARLGKGVPQARQVAERLRHAGLLIGSYAHLVLAPGLRDWIRHLSTPEGLGAYLTADPPAKARHPKVQEAARRLHPLLTQRLVVLHCTDAGLALAVGWALAEARGRRLLASTDHGADLLAAVTLAADVEGADALLVQPLDVFPRPVLRSLPTNASNPGPALLMLVHAGGADPHGLLEADLVIDLDRLAAEVGADSAERSPQPGKVAGWVAANRALYPDQPDLEESLTRLAQSTEDDVPSIFIRPVEADSPPVRRESGLPGLESLVLPTELRRTLEGVVARGRGRERCVVLLHGPPGTGKSQAARCVAGAMGSPAYVLDAGLTRACFYGQEERLLKAAFDAAEGDRAVLVVDEADQWLGRRIGSVGGPSGHHIAETAQMLLLLERFRGVAVLTTNRAETLDPALSRRVDLWLPLPLPDPMDRLVLWAQNAPDLGAWELALLAAVPLAGGDIEALVREAATCGEPSFQRIFSAARVRAERNVLLKA